MVLISDGQIHIEDKKTRMLPSLLQVNRQIRAEASPIYYLENVFALKPIVNPNRVAFFRIKLRAERMVGKSIYPKKRGTHPMEAFLKNGGASPYEKNIQVHWELRNSRCLSLGFNRRVTWDELVAWASTRWMKKLPRRAIPMSWSAQVSRRAFELWMILISTDTHWRDALKIAHFLQWIIDDRSKVVECYWTMSNPRWRDLTTPTNFVVRLKPSKELDKKGVAPSSGQAPDEVPLLYRPYPAMSDGSVEYGLMQVSRR